MPRIPIPYTELQNLPNDQVLREKIRRYDDYLAYHRAASRACYWRKLQRQADALGVTLEDFQANHRKKAGRPRKTPAPEVQEADAETPPVRKRGGRVRKEPDPNPPPKRPRGRPRKYPATQDD